MERINRNNCLTKNGLFVRRAKPEDINDLIEICRASFRDSLKWRGPRFFARKQWQFILGSAYCETWVCSYDGKVEGYVVLILDANRYNEQKRGQKVDFGTLLFILLIHPWLSITKAVKKISSEGQTNIKHSEVMNSTVKATSQLWIELIAVSSNMRRKSLGTTLLRFCELRAKDMGRKAIKLNVNKANISAIDFYENLGFVITAETKDSYVYVKDLTP